MAIITDIDPLASDTHPQFLLEVDVPFIPISRFLLKSPTANWQDLRIKQTLPSVRVLIIPEPLTVDSGATGKAASVR